MTKLSLSAVFVGAALVCAALPFSLHWVPMKTPSVSLDQAHAQFVGQQPSVARNVAGVSRRVQRRTYRRAAVRRAAVGAAAVGAATVGAAATGAYVAAPPPYYGPEYGYGAVGVGYPGPAPAAYGPYGYGGPEYGYVVEPGGYGRWCAVYPSGFRWCWTQT
jgi:hypothetical protein